MNIIFNWLLSATAILIAAYLLPGVSIGDPLTALVLAVVLAIANVTLRPLLLLFTLPINILTLGLFTFIVDAFIIKIADWLIEGFDVRNFIWALFFALVLSLVNTALHKFGKNKN